MSKKTIDTIPAVLTIDCGNTSIRCAHVRGEDVSGFKRVRIDHLPALESVLKELWEQPERPGAVVACSVNDEGFPEVEACVAGITGGSLQLVGRDLPLPIPVDPAVGSCVGADRVCAASAAYDRIGSACVVADFGSAITIDCVDNDGIFRGGAIMPGLGMAADALARNTSRLVYVEPAEPERLLSGDTRNAVLNGIVNGVRYALKGFVEAYATELHTWPEVILTGSDAGIVCPAVGRMGIVTAVVEDLTLRGAAMAYYRSLLENT